MFGHKYANAVAKQPEATAGTRRIMLAVWQKSFFMFRYSENQNR